MSDARLFPGSRAGSGSRAGAARRPRRCRGGSRRGAGCGERCDAQRMTEPREAPPAPSAPGGAAAPAPGGAAAPAPGGAPRTRWSLPSGPHRAVLIGALLIVVGIVGFLGVLDSVRENDD